MMWQLNLECVRVQDMREAYLEIHGGSGWKRDRVAARFDAQLVAFAGRGAGIGDECVE